MIRYGELWYPDGDQLTVELRARLDRQAVYFGDRLEEALAECVRRRRMEYAIEIGAHVGHWTIELARRFEWVAAIEPNPANAECLDANLREREIWNVDLRRQAVGAELGEIGLENGKGHISAHVVPGSGIPLVPLDMERFGSDVDPPNIDYIKVHCNGYELHALRGAVETLRLHRPVLTVVIKPACARYGVDPAAIPLFLERLGYRAARVHKPYWVFVPKEAA